MKFVEFKRDWADEFDVYGFALMTTEEWNEYSEKYRKANTVSYGFGSNQSFDDEDADDFLSDLNAVDISIGEAAVLRKVFKLRKYGEMETWGHFPDDPFFDNDDSQDEW